MSTTVCAQVSAGQNPECSLVPLPRTESRTPQPENPLITTSLRASVPNPVVTTPVDPLPEPPASEQTVDSSLPPGQQTSLESSPIATPGSKSSSAHGTVPQASQSPGSEDASNGFSSKGISPGAVAGIAIATAFIGAALALLIAFLLFKRRQRSRDSNTYSGPELVVINKPGSHRASPEMAQVPPHTGKENIDLTSLAHSSDFLAGILPQTADDREVKERVGTLFDQILLHVENYYRDVHVTITTSLERDLSTFLTPESGKLLRGNSRPTVAIKHILTSYVLDLTTPEGNGRFESLFPRDVAGVGNGSGAQFSKTPGIPAAYIIYRRLAVHLNTLVQPSSTINNTRSSNIHTAASNFSLALFPWANPDYSDHDKDEHLAKIIGNALKLRIWLFGQPFVHDFVWDDIDGRRGVVVSPGFVKLSDSRGRIERRKGQVLLSPNIING